MGMTRNDRVSIHTKQRRLQIIKGVPDIRELREGVPALRTTEEGLVEYIRSGNDLYKTILIKDSIAPVSINTTEVPTSFVLATYISQIEKVKDILAVLRDKGILRKN